MLLSFLENLLILVPGKRSFTLYYLAPKGSHLSNLSIKLTLIYDDIFTLQVINSWLVILGHGVELDLNFFLMESIKSSFLFRLRLLPSNSKNVVNGVTQPSLHLGL